MVGAAAPGGVDGVVRPRDRRAPAKERWRGCFDPAKTRTAVTGSGARALVHRSLDPITPLEAAVRANRAVMVSVLLANGAVPDGGTWTAVCESERNEIDAIRALLEPLTSSPSCPPRRDADQR